jgi:hypothetical protein
VVGDFVVAETARVPFSTAVSLEFAGALVVFTAKDFVGFVLHILKRECFNVSNPYNIIQY